MAHAHLGEISCPHGSAKTIPVRRLATFILRLALWLPLGMAVFILSVARATIYRPHYRLGDVIRCVRKLEITDLSTLFDPAEEWALRTLTSERDFRAAQRERLHLALEYVRRVGHNAEIIQAWAGALYEVIRSALGHRQ
jgi:hypothetical protein